jgi:hypothetical protein
LPQFAGIFFGPERNSGKTEEKAMSALRFVLLCCAAASLSACMSSEPASRGVADPAPLAPIGAPLPGASETVLAVPELAVQGVTVSVPRDLKVSEANLFKPRADIVWRGDPRGDRYAQVQAIAEAGARAATAPMASGQPVTLDIEIRRFHALTEKARYSAPFGAEFEFEVVMVLRDAETGALLGAPRVVKRDFAAASGRLALEEEARGITQKSVITGDFARMIAEELARAMPMPAASVAVAGL